MGHLVTATLKARHLALEHSLPEPAPLEAAHVPASVSGRALNWVNVLKKSRSVGTPAHIASEKKTGLVRKKAVEGSASPLHRKIMPLATIWAPPNETQKLVA
jgi:hypothetical protein